ncbi:hypothetical protein E2542_SST28153 [Spatholobus suberectus]|nr:hypothetical protein E2542_SST28153 [Spatholobus suberectus]
MPPVFYDVYPSHPFTCDDNYEDALAIHIPESLVPHLAIDPLSPRVYCSLFPTMCNPFRSSVWRKGILSLTAQRLVTCGHTNKVVSDAKVSSIWFSDSGRVDVH